MKKRLARLFKIDPTFQKLFIVMAFGAAFAQVIPIVTTMIQQYSSNRNMSGFYVFLISSVAAPIIYFIVSYVTSHQIARQLHRVFYSTILTTMTLFFYTILQQAIIYIAAMAQAPYDFSLVHATPFLIAMIGLTIYITKTKAKL